MPNPYPTYASYTPPVGSSISTNAAAGVVVCPYVPKMAADASGDIGSVQQETVTVTDVQYTYTASLNVLNAYKFLNAFTVSGHGPNVGDQLDVNVTDVSGLREVIRDGLDAVKSSINSNMESDLMNQIARWIQSDGLLNTVEDAAATNAHVAIDSSDGAANMANSSGLSSVGAGPLRRVLYTQISNTALMAYKDVSEEPITNAFPLRQGDSITFVWDIEPTLTSFNYTQTDITSTYGSAVAGQYSGSKSIVGASTRHAVTFVIPTLSGGSIGDRLAVYGDVGSSAGSRLKGPTGTA